MAQEGVPSLEAWLKANIPEGSVLGIDPNVHSIDEAEVRHHAGARPRARVRISCYLVRVGRAACAPAMPLQARVGTYLYTPSARCH